MIMSSNTINYFNTNLLFIKCDISLMKYLMTQPEIRNKFNIKDILSLSDINSSSKFIQDLLNSNTNSIELIDARKEKNLLFNNSLIEFLYLIIRDNLSLEKIAFFNSEFEAKMKDEIYEKLYQNEKDRIKDLVKNEIIHFILSKQNVVKRDDCINYFEKNFDGNYTELIDEILKNNCEKLVLANGLLNFSLKKEILNKCDLDYIISLESRK